ncbi:MAG: hypothetical protein GWP06_05165, partial [Actinobacteria bacterium]|nr:hypothetical protein [Actinomycetota bacterium]
VLRFKNDIENIIDEDKRAILNFIPARLEQLLNAAKSCNIYFLKLGEIEHYYTQSEIDYLNITNKDIAFHKERNFILNSDAQTIKDNYGKLINLFEEIIPTIDVKLIEHIKYILIEWIQKVQSSIVRGEIENIEHLKRNARINYNLFNQIIEIVEFQFEENNKFKCKIKISSKLIDRNIEIEFDENTTPANFNIE